MHVMYLSCTDHGANYFFIVNVSTGWIQEKICQVRFPINRITVFVVHYLHSVIKVTKLLAIVALWDNIVFQHHTEKLNGVSPCWHFSLYFCIPLCPFSRRKHILPIQNIKNDN